MNIQDGRLETAVCSKKKDCTLQTAAIWATAYSLVCFMSKPICDPDRAAQVGHIGCYVWICGGVVAQWAANSRRYLLAALKSLSSSSLSSDFISSCFRLWVAISAACFFLHFVRLFWNHTCEQRKQMKKKKLDLDGAKNKHRRKGNN